jgi:hypothetical protein
LIDVEGSTSLVHDEKELIENDKEQVKKDSKITEGKDADKDQKSVEKPKPPKLEYGKTEYRG